MLDIYCERGMEAGVWAEPANLVTNLAFILAGLLALRVWARQPGLTLRRGWDLLLLAALPIAIGIGSGLWHAFATRWAVLADVIPITLFIDVFLLSVLVRVAGLPWWGALLGFLAYQALNLGLFRLVPPASLNGSAGYLPALIVLAGLWVWLALRAYPLTRAFGAATGLFFISLTFRTLDRELCALWPLGTHFLWHLLNASLLYLLIVGLIRHGSGNGRELRRPFQGVGPP